MKKFLDLDQILDENMILRFEGRLSKSELECNEKHRILLPRAHKLNKSIHKI